MTIHDSHPFPQEPDPVRRFRGRLGGAVTLWTAGEGAGRTGLTVSSMILVNGEPGTLVAALDPDADLTEALDVSGTAVVTLLRWADRDLAEAFAGTAPAPGGPFRLGAWEQSSHGPLLADRSHALVRVTAARPLGWSLLVEAAIEEVVVRAQDDALEHRRGRFRRVDGDGQVGP